jgi:hypothetical protein
MTIWAALLLLAQVEVPAPAGLDLSKPFRVVRSDGAELPAQAAGTSIVLPGGAGGELKAEAVAPKAHPQAELLDDGRTHLLLRVGNREVLRYNYAVVQAPEGVDRIFDRSGYLHPLWTPDGRVITNDFPAKHLHHHGIWFPWTSSEFEGRKSDFWNSKDGQGKVEFVKMLGTSSGPVFAGFRAEHRFINLTAPEGPKAALLETWEVRVYPAGNRYMFDLVSVQTCATEAPLLIRKYRYGGLGFRGPAEWEGKDGVAYLTSEGKTRENGHESTARWCVMSGKVAGRAASIGFLCHPSNFRFPQNMRIHPDEPFFNWAPPQAGDFSIEPGKPYVSRYRFIVADESLTPDEMNVAWKAYAEPPAVSWK